MGRVSAAAFRRDVATSWRRRTRANFFFTEIRLGPDTPTLVLHVQGRSLSFTMSPPLRWGGERCRFPLVTVCTFRAQTVTREPAAFDSDFDVDKRSHARLCPACALERQRHSGTAANTKPTVLPCTFLRTVLFEFV